MRRERPDLVHANSSKAGVLGRLAASLAARAGTHVHRPRLGVQGVHGPRVALYRWADRLMAPLTTVTICVSETERAAGLAARTCRPSEPS